MDITFFGQASFKIKGKNASVVTDPFDGKMLGIKYPKVDADIVTVSHHHGDHDKVENVENVKRVVDGPGEYEINGVSIIGLPTFHDAVKGAERGKNTIYVIEIDGLRLLHLGDLGHTLPDETVKEIGPIDIMMIPVGGSFTIDAEKATQVQKQVGASIVVPMHYRLDGLTPELSEKLAPVEDFITASSLRTEKLPKLSVKFGDINNEEEYAVILEKK
ncbi:MAG TPA: MBL fold metallo-hydrolase [Patescibacteria group bacterium]|nr:MBL fold metallo-hydrolase [Patescibacteria group bacterium]